MTTGASVPPGLAELVRRFRPGYELERTGSNHFRVRDPEGKLVQLHDKNVTLSGTAHGGRALNNMIAQLDNAGVLLPLDAAEVERRRRRTEHLHATPEARARHREATAAAAAERNRARQADADALYERLDPLLRQVGGFEMQGMQADLGHIGAWLAQQNGTAEGFDPTKLTPDLFVGSAQRVMADRKSVV